MAAAGAAEDIVSSDTDSPDSLWAMCLNYCASNLRVLGTYNDHTGWTLHDFVHLSSQICDALLHTFHQRDLTLNDELMHLFRDDRHTKLQRINLRGAEITDRCIKWIMPHEPRDLNLMGCPNLTTGSLYYINSYGKKLTMLTIGTYWGLFSDLDLSSDGEKNSEEIKALIQKGLELPQLQALTLRNLVDLVFCAQDVVRWVLKPLTRLSFLDLSGCDIDIGNLEELGRLENLTKLILYNVKVSDMHRVVATICKLTKLRALDLSQGGEQPVTYPDPERHLVELLDSLPHLRWLDIAGTNLAGFEQQEVVIHKKDIEAIELGEGEAVSLLRSSIPGLQGRHLDFLGLLMCSHNACTRENIPATQVTGSANEAQVLLSIQTYQDKPNLLTKALNELFNLFRYVNVQRKDVALQAVIGAMKANPLNNFIQTLGVACLVFMVKHASKHGGLNHRTKRQTISAIISAMEMHQNLIMLMRRGCLALSYFDLPFDLLFCYGRIIKMLIYLVTHLSHDENLTQVALFLMKHLSSQVDITYKEYAGQLGAISSMLEVIKDILETDGECDSVMLRAWSVLWSLTDMSPSNSELFMNGDGMRTFNECYERFSDEDSLTRKMIGMMCNVAEVQSLRSKLIQADYVETFIQMLEDELNISNSACGVLAHLLADGPEAWQENNTISRDMVITQVTAAIDSWDVETRRNVRYRSFEPMTRLFQCFDTPVAQYWAAWEVCNMTKKDPERYCAMLESEGSIAVIQDITSDSRTSEKVKIFLQQVLDLYQQQKQLSEGLNLY